MTSDPHARLKNRIDLVIEKIRCNGQIPNEQHHLETL